MHTSQLRYFVSVAEYRSFTRAADSHYLTQTAITQQIRALEDGLGLQLINRQKRPIELTPAGQVFYREAKGLLARLDEAVAMTQEASAGMQGTIRIGYEKGYERSTLSDRLGAFHRSYPSILFTCIRSDSDHLAQGLMSGELDVIFAWDSTNLRSMEDIGSRLDLRSPLAAALFGSHPLAGRSAIRREELRGETILYMTPSATGDSYGDDKFMGLYKRAGYEPRILLKSSDSESLLMMVAAEEGISILPSHIVDKLTNASNLRFVPMAGEEEHEDIFMLWRRSRDNPALQCLLRFLAEPKE